MRGKLYTERMEICLTGHQRKRLKVIADKQNLTVSQVIRNLIEKSLVKGA